jgi:hypothetical protein
VRSGFIKTYGRELDAGTKVEAGSLGGEGRCWSVRLDDVTPAALCVFADRGSVLSVLDTVTPEVAQAAPRAVIAREALLSEG